MLSLEFGFRMVDSISPTSLEGLSDPTRKLLPRVTFLWLVLLLCVYCATPLVQAWISGLVNAPLALTLDDLRSGYDPLHQFVTLACISNPIAGDLTGVWDASRLRQVISNLLNNAARYSPAGSNIDVSLACDEDHVTISIRDNGSGIESSLLPHIFTPFFANHEKDLAKSGLGIGLSLTQRLVELHGGVIVAKSEGPGSCIRLPRRITLRSRCSPRGTSRL